MNGYHNADDINARIENGLNGGDEKTKLKVRLGIAEHMFDLLCNVEEFYRTFSKLYRRR